VGEQTPCGKLGESKSGNAQRWDPWGFLKTRYVDKVPLVANHQTITVLDSPAGKPGILHTVTVVSFDEVFFLASKSDSIMYYKTRRSRVQ